jgi:predicted ATPase
VVLPGDRVPETGGYPWDLPAVRGIRDAPLDLDHDVVFLVGENGSGKSTLVDEIPDGIAPVALEDTEHFRLTRAFLEAPERLLRTLPADD